MTDTDELHWQLDTGYPHTLRPELHKALMARGIDYWLADGITFWNRDDGCECLAYGYQVDGVPKLAIKVVGFTDPEQAIAATLGAGTCHLKPWEMERDTGFYDCMECDCGYVADVADWAEWSYCPKCGRRNVEMES